MNSVRFALEMLYRSHMEDHQREFHMEEFRQLKMEITALLSRIGYLFRYSLISSAIIYSWLVTQATHFSSAGPCLTLPKDLVIYSLWIPPIFVLLSGVIASLTFSHVHVVGSYIKTVEEKLGASGLGWEQHWTGRGPSIAFWFRATWILLFAGCLIGTFKFSLILNTLTNCTS